MSLLNAMYGGGGGRPTDNEDYTDQKVQTLAIKVYDRVGVQRNEEARKVEDPTRRIGGSTIQLEDFDSRLNIYKGDPVLIDVSAIPSEMSYDPSGFDGRPFGISSLAGYQLPDHIVTPSDFERNFRYIGVAGFDFLVENARTNQAPKFGLAVYTGGATGGHALRHVVPEKIGVGELLRIDIGPMDNADRIDWQKDFLPEAGPWRRDSCKPVVRPWDPYGGAMLLTDAYEQGLSDTLSLTASEKQAISDPSQSGVPGSRIQPTRALGQALVKAQMGISWMTLVLAARAGIVTFAQNWETAQTAQISSLFETPQKDFDVLAAKLGLTGGAEDPKLMAALFGAVWQPLTNDIGIADRFDMAKLSPTNGQQIQEQTTVRLIRAVTDAYYENASKIAFKAMKNSVQGNRLSVVILH